MKRHRENTIDMTPLLDVVFILLFALIMNVTVAQAEDEAVITNQGAQIVALEQEKTILEEQKTALEEEIIINDEHVRNNEDKLDALSEALENLVNMDLQNLQDPETIESLEAMFEEGDLVDTWLRYQQVADKYLFVEIKITNDHGRTYLNGNYTGINIDQPDVIDREVRSEKVANLSNHILNWLDHRQGGYSFVFVTLVSEDEVTRAATNVLQDALNRLQLSFNKDYYMINKYIRYE
ncbi:MAG: biopolymer transporter ExbD [Vallitaleaceae bacterium]|nr:biopolymer transporter ExbD [Vallitaleaceae bacterium]